jgi:alpha-ketoglutarate-dependent taurine dioxygenase
MALTVRRLHPALGAEVRGVDFRRPIPEDVRAELNAAWMEHLVLVFPEQPVTDEQQVALTRVFGEPEIFHQNIIRSRLVPEIFRVSNVDDDGNLMAPEHPTVQQVNLARRWHTDSSYRENPAMGSLLHGVEVSRTGGLTCFINM